MRGEIAILALTVVLCTYNGAVFLDEFLVSLANQIRLPDRLLVLDDCSTDSTVYCIERFAENAPFKIELLVNNANLGSTKNFEKAIGLATGDILLLADQDDVWLPTKLLDIEYFMMTFPDVGYVFTDAFMVDCNIGKPQRRLWQNIQFTDKKIMKFQQGKELDVLLNSNCVTGATVAFRSQYRDVFLPIPTVWVHDAWIALIAAVFGIKGMPIQKPLILYRQHNNQQIGIKKRNAIQKLIYVFNTRGSSMDKKILMFTTLQAEIEERLSQGLPTVQSETLTRVRDKRQHLIARSLIRSERSFASLCQIYNEIRKNRYSRYSKSWASAIQDVISWLR